MRFAVFALLCASVLMMSCGTDDTTAVVNLPPTITFNQAAIGFPKNGLHELSVTINDPDEDDNLTTSWSITRGTLMPISGSRTRMNWQAPSTVGRDTLRVSVSDGELTDRIEAEILVGSPRTSLSGVLTLADSPYIIQFSGSPTISVFNGTVIEAGVEILFDVVNGTLSVNGTFTSQGTDALPVVIRPNNRTLRCQDQRGWWKGIEVFTGGNLNFDHTDITYGKFNVRVLETGNATLTNCELKCSKEAAVLMESSGSVIIDNCVISNNASAGVSLRGSKVPNTVSITNSHILLNGSAGIRMELADVFQQANILVKYNKIEFNFTYGVFLMGDVFPEVRLNHFAANGLSGGLSNIRLNYPYPENVIVPFDTMQADSNFWDGALTQAAIDATIHDRLDDARIGTRVVTDPWLDTSPTPQLVVQ